MSITVDTIPQIQDKKPITRMEMFGYGFGGLGNNISSMVVASFIVYFMTDVVGLSAAAAGAIYLVSKILDAVLDPVVGALSDRTVSRWGRYRPYMIFGGLLAAVLYVMLFVTVPLSPVFKTIYYLVVYCAWSFGFTLTVMPYQSVVATLSSDRQKRNIIVTVGKLVSAPVGLVVAYCHDIVAVLGKGDEAAGWRNMIILFAIIVVVSMWICSYSIRRFDNREIAQKATTKQSGAKYTFKERLLTIKGNRALFMLTLALGTNTLADACLNSTQNYYAKYVLEDMSFISTVGTLATMVTVPIFILAPILTKRFAKRDIFKVATIIHVLFPVFLLFPSSGNSTLIIVLCAISKATGMLCNIIAFMMLPDCVDFGYKLSGIVSAGLITSTFTFANKFGGAIGGFVSTTILDIAGFEANTVQAPIVLTAIVLCMSVPTILSDIASYIGMKLYPIDERRREKKG